MIYCFRHDPAWGQLKQSLKNQRRCTLRPQAGIHRSTQTRRCIDESGDLAPMRGEGLGGVRCCVVQRR